MSESPVRPREKVHPLTRAVEPNDPMALHGFEVPGDSELMFRMLVEEFARMGHGCESIMAMFRDPEYQVPHGLWQLYGDEDTQRRLADVLAQCGVLRTTVEFTNNVAVHDLEIPEHLQTEEEPATTERGDAAASVDPQHVGNSSQP